MNKILLVKVASKLDAVSFWYSFSAFFEGLMSTDVAEKSKTLELETALYLMVLN